MSKREFLKRVRATRAALNVEISGLSDAHLTQEIVAGEWTAKDILAHIAAWQAEAGLAAQRVARGQPHAFMDEDDTDEWNRRRVDERRRLPLVDVIQEFNDAHDTLLTALGQCPDDGGSGGPVWWTPDGPLWWLTEHDAEHVAAIHAFRERIAES